RNRRRLDRTRGAGIATTPYPRALLRRLPAHSRQPAQITASEDVLVTRSSGRRKPRKFSRTLCLQNSQAVSECESILRNDESSNSGLRLLVNRKPVSMQLTQIGPRGPAIRYCLGSGRRPQNRHGTPAELPAAALSVITPTKSRAAVAPPRTPTACE